MMIELGKVYHDCLISLLMAFYQPVEIRLGEY